MAKDNCKHCYGRGYIGYTTNQYKQKIKVPCKCASNEEKKAMEKPVAGAEVKK